MDTIKHGIIVIKHKKYSTKKIYNSGYLMRSYKKCPNVIKFKNEMINDINQHYCGGWYMTDLKYDTQSQLNLLLENKKPLLVLHDGKEELQTLSKSIDIKRFDYEIYKNWAGYRFIIISVKGTLDQLFDLDTLKQDYINNGIDIDVYHLKNKKLKDYFHGWITHGNPDIVDPWELWEIGLMLGYPIENTISIYLQ